MLSDFKVIDNLLFCVHILRVIFSAILEPDVLSHFCRYFSCAFYGDNLLLSTAYALNKKDAKTKAAADALNNLLFRELVRNIKCLFI